MWNETMWNSVKRLCHVARTKTGSQNKHTDRWNREQIGILQLKSSVKSDFNDLWMTEKAGGATEAWRCWFNPYVHGPKGAQTALSLRTWGRAPAASRSSGVALILRSWSRRNWTSEAVVSRSWTHNRTTHSHFTGDSKFKKKAFSGWDFSTKLC